MKKLVLYIVTFLILVSCAGAPLEIMENDDGLRMIGGKQALLDDIVYPADALQKGIEDIVTVLAYVDTSGTVIDCKIMEGNEFLNEAAITAMTKQRFHPFMLEGKKRPVRVAIPISFTIAKDLDVYEFERERVKSLAEKYLEEPVLTINDHRSVRSPGTANDYYSEAMTWWPKPDDPTAPYMIKEGVENPDAFLKHQELLGRMSEIVSALTSAYLITDRKDYAFKAIEHIKAWFIDPETRMNPNFKYAQTIPYRNTGRLAGIMNALPMVEVIRSMDMLKDLFDETQLSIIDEWMHDYDFYLEFGDYMEYAMQRKDNYALVWFLQIASVARYREDREKIEKCRYYFKEHLLKFISDEGSDYYNGNMNRQYTNNIFLAADMSALAVELITDDTYNAWVETDGIRRAGDLINYMYSGILNYDLKLGGYYDGRFISLLLAGKAYENSRYLQMWRDLNSGDPEKTDFPIREPVLWTK